MKTKILCAVLVVMFAGSVFANGNDDLTSYGKDLAYWEAIVSFLKHNFL